MDLIREIRETELADCLAVIRRSFETVAADFSLTRENCPGHTSFLAPERLRADFAAGWQMVAAFREGEMTGFYALSREAADCFELHHLAVLPVYRHCGLGRRLLDDAKARARTAGAGKIAIGIIEDSVVLKRWYMENGFVPVGTKQFSHLPFTVGFLEWRAGE